MATMFSNFQFHPLLFTLLISQATGLFIHAHGLPQNTSPDVVCVSQYKLLQSDFQCGNQIKCSTIVSRFPDLGTGQTGLDNFFALNPQVNNPACDNLHLGQVYCVASLNLGVRDGNVRIG